MVELSGKVPDSVISHLNNQEMIDIFSSYN